MTDRRVVFAEIPVDLYRALRHAAVDEDRSLRAIVEDALRARLEVAS